MNSQYKITPRNLGSICIETFCPRCFWVLSKLKFHGPFDHSGAAIFHDCQAMQEAVVGYYLSRDGGLPKEFAPFCDCKARAEFPKHWSKFGYLHKSDVWLYGVPDDIFWRSNNTLSVWDHKTAHPKSGEDPYLPQYETQVIGYGNIAELGLKIGKVSNGGLMYWEVQHQAVIEDPSKFIKDGRFWAPFVPRPIEVDMNYSRLDKLLEEAKKIWNSLVPPKGRDGCPDCNKLDALLAIEAEVQKELTAQDERILAGAGHSSWAVNSVMQERRARDWALTSALWTLQKEGDDPHFAEGCMAANWEFFDD